MYNSHTRKYFAWYWIRNEQETEDGYLTFLLWCKLVNIRWKAILECSLTILQELVTGIWNNIVLIKCATLSKSMIWVEPLRVHVSTIKNKTALHPRLKLLSHGKLVSTLWTMTVNATKNLKRESDLQEVQHQFLENTLFLSSWNSRAWLEQSRESWYHSKVGKKDQDSYSAMLWWVRAVRCSWEVGSVAQLAERPCCLQSWVYRRRRFLHDAERM